MKFIADCMFGKLARWLRMAGYDTAYVWPKEREKLISNARIENRIIITSARKIKYQYEKVFIITDIFAEKQFVKVVKEFNLDFESAFTLCTKCGCSLVKTDKESIIKKIPSDVAAWCDEYFLCENCGSIYWKGSHYEKMKEVFLKLKT